MQAKKYLPLEQRYIIIIATEACAVILKYLSITAAKLTIIFNRQSLLNFRIDGNVHSYCAAYLCAYYFEIDYQ